MSFFLFSKIRFFSLITNTFLYFIVPYRSLLFTDGTARYVSSIGTFTTNLCTVIRKMSKVFAKPSKAFFETF